MESIQYIITRAKVKMYLTTYYYNCAVETEKPEWLTTLYTRIFARKNILVNGRFHTYLPTKPFLVNSSNNEREKVLLFLVRASSNVI